MHSQEMVKARERQAARKKFLDRARKAEDRRELWVAQNKRRVSQRKAMKVREMKEHGKAARDIQVRFETAHFNIPFPFVSGSK